MTQRQFVIRFWVENNGVVTVPVSAETQEQAIAKAVAGIAIMHVPFAVLTVRGAA